MGGRSASRSPGKASAPSPGEDPGGPEEIGIGGAGREKPPGRVADEYLTSAAAPVLGVDGAPAVHVLSDAEAEGVRAVLGALAARMRDGRRGHARPLGDREPDQAAVVEADIEGVSADGRLLLGGEKVEDEGPGGDGDDVARRVLTRFAAQVIDSMMHSSDHE